MPNNENITASTNDLVQLIQALQNAQDEQGGPITTGPVSRFPVSFPNRLPDPGALQPGLGPRASGNFPFLFTGGSVFEPNKVVQRSKASSDLVTNVVPIIMELVRKAQEKKAAEQAEEQRQLQKIPSPPGVTNRGPPVRRRN